MSDTPNTPAPAAAPADSSPGGEGQEPQVQGDGAEGQEQQSVPKKKAPSFRKYKIGDEEVALSDADIVRELQKARGADAKFREASQARQSVEAFMAALQNDPEAVLNDPRLSINRRKLAEKWLTEQLESELNPPDPRDAKLTETERRLKEYEDREAKEKQTKEQQAYAAQIEQRKTALSTTLAEAMQASPLSAHPETAASTLREMALYMRAATERGETVTASEILEHVHNGRFNQFYTLANEFEGDDLIEFLGEEVVKRIRKADLARIKAQQGSPGPSHRADSWQPRSEKKPQRMDINTARELARKQMRREK